MEMTKSNRKMVASLATAKGRREHRLFAAEGTRCVMETITHYDCRHLLATDLWLSQHSKLLPEGLPDITVVKRSDLIEMSSLSTPPDVMAVYDIPHTQFVMPTASQLSLALDRVQDPGNLGTIVRIASWMGISHIYCSHDTVDLYNPKAVQATMGGLTRVQLHYTDLPQLLEESRKSSIPVYGTFLDGEDIYTTTLTDGGIIVMGNEGNGISDEVARHISHRILIPSYPPEAQCVESLNVSVATAITVAEFRRRSLAIG
ncbi:MAG: RNA methyltransferase [Clostridiales bacterium]|nr:RNA methyltransferase [Clostridiales bacterium]